MLLFRLRIKLAVLASLLLIFTIGLVSTVVIDQLTAAVEEQARDRVIYMAKNLAQNARDAVLAQEELAIDQLLRSVAQQSFVSFARLVDAQGRVIGSSRPEHEGRTFNRIALEDSVAVLREDNKLAVAARMQFSDVVIGEAQVVLDLGQIIVPVLERTIRWLYLTSGALLVSGILLMFLMSTFITRPLGRLRDAVNALAAGDTSARVPVTTRDEVAELTKAFNQMSQNLHEKQRVESAFRRYVSDHVLREVLDKPETIRLRGERREVTAIFIDIRKFTRLATEIGPERLVAYLNSALGLITNRLLDHGATVDKYLGDAVLAYFGTPIYTQDHPQRAVACAIAIQRSVRERNAKLEATGQPFERLDVGIGIQTGEVVVGNIGSELKMDYTAIGDAVNVASRLQALAEAGEILITHDMLKRLGDLIEVEPLGIRELEGREEPVDLYRVRY